MQGLTKRFTVANESRHQAAAEGRQTHVFFAKFVTVKRVPLIRPSWRVPTRWSKSSDSSFVAFRQRVEQLRSQASLSF
jgi:hypothetical protein